MESWLTRTSGLHNTHLYHYRKLSINLGIDATVFDYLSNVLLGPYSQGDIPSHSSISWVSITSSRPWSPFTSSGSTCMSVNAFTSNVNIMTSIPRSNYSSAFKRVRAAMAPRPQPKIPSYIPTQYFESHRDGSETLELLIRNEAGEPHRHRDTIQSDLFGKPTRSEDLPLLARCCKTYKRPDCRTVYFLKRPCDKILWHHHSFIVTR